MTSDLSFAGSQQMTLSYPWVGFTTTPSRQTDWRPDVQHRPLVSCQASTSAIERFCKKLSSKVNWQ